MLRMSPAAHQTWLSIAAPGRELYELARPWSFDTQRQQIVASIPDPEIGEPIQGISVILSADIQEVEGPVQPTDRGQILDGIIRYGDELLIVIETKLDGPADTQQAQELNLCGSPVRFDTAVRSVSWRHLLDKWSDLVDSELVVGAELLLMIDFLDFVEQYFPKLGPFVTLARCKRHPFRVNRRLRAVLEEISGGPTRGWLELPDRSTINRAYLEFDELSQQIRLIAFPAENLTQAKAFYTRPRAASSVVSLGDIGWQVQPYFHFGFVAAGFVVTKTDAQLEEYVEYWRTRIQCTCSMPRQDWEAFWAEMVRQRFARTEEKAQFDRAFTDTRRNSATPRPGLKCSYSWSLFEATALDDAGLLVAAVAGQVNALLSAIGEHSSEFIRR